MHLQETTESIAKPSGGLLGGWISRTDLALQLGVSEDTLRRWDVLRSGPPCTRAGRKVFYRRATVIEWLEDQEKQRPTPQTFGGPSMSALPHPARQSACVGQAWIAARLREARTVISEASAHSDHLLRLACNVVISHGQGETERAGARALLFAIDARSPARLQIGTASSAELRGRT